MPKINWFKALFILVFLMLVKEVNAQIKFKVLLLNDSLTYQVSLLSEIGPFSSLGENIVSSGTVTLTAPTGQFVPEAMTNSLVGNWNSPDVYVNPIAGLNRDYIVINLNNLINNITFSPGLEVPLFTIVNTNGCPGAVEIMDNDNDPARNGENNLNLGNHIVVFGYGQPNAFGGAYDPGSANCMGFPPCSLTIDSVSMENISTCGLADGTIAISTSGGAGAVQYSIDNGINWFTNPNFTGLNAANYSIIVKDDLCEQIYGNNPVSISEPGITVNLISTMPPSCSNSQDGLIQIAGGDGIPPYQYSINDGISWSTDSIFSALGNGTYRIKARNADSSCVTTYSANPIVLSTQGINIEVNKTDISCSTGAKGIISILAQGGTGSFQYSIDDGNTWLISNTFTDLNSGSYTIKVRNSNGNCEVGYFDNPVTINENVLNFSINTTQPSCSGEMNGSITFLTNGETGAFEYSIDEGQTWTSDSVFANLDTGGYHLIVRNPDTTCVTAYSSNPLQLSTSEIDISVTTFSDPCGDQTSNSLVSNSLRIFAVGGSGSLQYSIDNGVNWQSSSVFSDLDTGSYTVVVSIADSTCLTPYTNNPVVFSSSPIAVNVSSSSPSCPEINDGSITITATGGSGGYFYSIDDGLNYSNLNTFTGLGNGNYIVKVRNADGTCPTSYKNNPLSMNTPALNLQVNSSGPSCPGASDISISLLANGGTGAYQYSLDSGLTWSFNATYSDLPPSIYHLLLRNDNGTCIKAFDNNPLDLSSEPIDIQIVSNTPPSCNTDDGSLIISASTGNISDFEYSIDNGLTYFGLGTFQNLSAGNYLVKVRVAGTDCEVEYSGNPLMINDVCDPGNKESAMDTLRISLTKGATNEICIDSLLQIPSGVGMVDVCNSGSGITNVEVLNMDDCMVFNGVSVGRDTLCVFHCDIDQTDLCDTTLIIATVLPFENCVINYLLDYHDEQFVVYMIPDTTWVFPFNTISSAQITLRVPSGDFLINDFENLVPDVSFGESGRFNSPLIENGYDYISISLQGFGISEIPFVKGDTVSLFRFKNAGTCSPGSIELAGEGSTFPIPMSNLANIESQMTVLGWENADVPLCVQSEVISLCTPQITDTQVAGASYCGAEDGSIDFILDCANEFISYSIDSGFTFQAQPVFNGLAGGIYYLTIKNDTTGCMQTFSDHPVVLKELLLTIDVTKVPPSCADSTNGFISIRAENGNGNYLYSIDEGNSWTATPNFIGLSNGSYNIRVSHSDSTCLGSFSENPVVFNSVSCESDADNDGTADFLEDLNMDSNLENDDSDDDGIPNYLDPDDDNDGILTSTEGNAPNNGDGNDDGLPDCLQPEVASNQDDRGIYRTLEIEGGGCDGISAFLIKPEGFRSEDDPGYDFPYQLNAFRLNCSGTVNISLYYHNLTDIGDFIYRKYGPLVPGGATSLWYDFPINISQDTIGGNIVGKINFQLTDGQPGDSSLVDGIIIDPGGLANNHKDTVAVALVAGLSSNICLDDSIIQLPNQVGATSVLFQGAGVAGTTSIMDSCVQLLAQPTFTGNDYVTVVFCDNINTAICDTTVFSLTVSGPDSCIVRYILEDSMGTFITSMISDTTWEDPLNTVISSQLTFRVPAGTFELANLQNAIGPVDFDAQGQYRSGDYDYLVIGQQTLNTVDIPFVKGDTVRLFTFENGGLCTADSIYLIGDGSLVEAPLIGDEDIRSRLVVQGWGTQAVPTCVMAYGLPLCPEPETIRDTIFLEMNYRDTLHICIDSVLQLYSNVGNVSLCSTPTNINYQINDNDSCFTINPIGPFIGMEAACLVHCDIAETGHCDTTIIIINVIAPAQVPADTQLVVLDFNETDTICIGDHLQLANGVGTATVLTNGINVTATTIDNDSCIILNPDNNYSGMDTVRVIHCDQIDTDLCDTTLLFITVNPEDTTTTGTPTCVLNFDLELIGGTYRVSMTPDTTFPNTFFAGLTRAMDITIRAPSGQLEITNHISFNSGYEFRLIGLISNPSESPGYDYLMFGLKESNVPTLSIPYNKGEKVDLFSFQNATCSADSLTLVGNGSTFAITTIGDESIITNADVNGWTDGIMPVCVSSEAVPLCHPSPDTLYLEITGDATEEICLSNVLDLPNTIGTAVFCGAGTNVSAVLSNSDTCLQIQPLNNFTGEEMLCVVHCDSDIPDFCDTTYIRVTVIQPACTDSVNAGIDQTICPGTSVQLTAVGTASNYSWSPTTGLSCTDCQSPMAFPTTTTTYIVTNSEGACTATDTITVIVNPSLSAGYSFTTGCTDYTVSFTDQSTSVAGLDAWAWDFGDGNGFASVQNPVYTYAAPGTYMVRLISTTEDNCTDTLVMPVEVGNGLTTTVGVGDTICAGDCLTLTASGGVTYSWFPSTGLSDTTSANPIVCPLQTTTYYVTISDGSTCSAMDSVTVFVETPGIGASVTHVTDCDQNDGRITVFASVLKGVLEFKVNDSPWQSSGIFAGLAPGNYNIVVRKTGGTCETSYINNPVIINGITAPEIDSLIFTDPSACTVADGSIRILANGTSSLLYSIDGGINWSTDSDFTGLGQGIYNPAVAYADTSCITIGELVNINSPVTPVITSVLGLDPTTCGGMDGSISVSATGDNGNQLEYSLDGQNWQTINIFNNLEAGDYRVFVRYTDQSCLTEYADIIVLNAQAAPEIISVDTTNPLDCGPATGVVSINARGIETIEYSIDGGFSWSLNNTFSGLDTGTYLVKIRYENQSCEVAYGQPVVLSSAIPPVISNVIATDPTGCSLSDGQIRIIANGSETLEYSIDDGQTWRFSDQFTNLAAGVYQIKVRGENSSCSSSYVVPVVLNQGVSPEITNLITTNPSDCDLQNGSIQVFTNATGFIEYSIDNGQHWTANSFFDGLSEGVYSVKIRIGDCEAAYGQNPVILTNTNAFKVINPIPNKVSCQDTYMSVSVALNEDISSYSVDQGIIKNPVITGSSMIFDAVIEGFINEYTLTFSNAAGCQVSESFIIFRANNTEADFVVIEPFCKASEVELFFTGTATPAARLIWELDGGVLIDSSPATDSTPAGNVILVKWDTEGSKLIKLTVDDGGCTDDEFESIFIRKLPLVDAGEDRTICMGSCTELNGLGTGVWYTWSPEEGLDDPNSPNPLACPETTTTYTLTVMSADGCVSMDSVTVTVEDNFVATSGDHTICEGESVRILATGSTNYEWWPAESIDNPFSANPLVSPSRTTTYYVRSRNDRGCMDTTSLTITVNPAPEAIACEDKTICRGDSIQLVVTTHAQYDWSPATSLINSNTGTPVAFPSQTTIYTVTVKDEFGCTDTDEVVVFVNEPLEVNLGPDISLCEPGQISLDAGPGQFYSWFPTTGLSDPTVRNPVATVNSTTTYSVTVTNAEGCSASDQVTISITGGPRADAGPNLVLCPGEIGQLNASGGVAYSWSPTTGLSDPNIANPYVNPSQVTSYRVTVTDEQGCTATDEVLVIVSLPLMVDPEIRDANCCGQGGSATLNVSGGFGNATFEWSPNVSQTNTASDLEAGFYKVIIRDAEGCSIVFTFEIKEDCSGCPDLIAETERCLNDTSLTERICIPIPLEEINNYRITVNGDLYIPDHGCDHVDFTAYSYALVEGQGNTGMYLVESWEVDGQMYSGEVENMAELTSWMNNVDPTGAWSLNTSTLTIGGGDPGKSYGNMKVIQLTKWIETVLQPDVTGLATKSIVEVDLSDNELQYNIVITDILTCCSDSLQLIRCGNPLPCQEDILTDTQVSHEIVCEDSTAVCLDIPFSSIFNYDLLLDGIDFSGTIQPCNYDSIFAYSYLTIPGLGSTGPYRINYWVINGNMHSGMFSTVEELVMIMNEIDHTGNWELNTATLILQGGSPETSYGIMIIEQISTGAVATLNINSTLIPMGTALTLQEGNHNVTFINKQTGCQDQIRIAILCEQDTTMNPVDTTMNPVDTTMNPVDTTMNPVDTTKNPVDTTMNPVDTTMNPVDTTMNPVDTTMNPVDTTMNPVDTTMNPVDTTEMLCEDFLAPEFLSATVDGCEGMTLFCLGIPFDSIDQYNIYLDEDFYNGRKDSCVEGTSVEIGPGAFNIILQHKLSGCRDSMIVAVTCNPVAQRDTIRMQVGEQFTYCPEADDLEGDISSLTNICSEESGEAVRLFINDTIYCMDYSGESIGQERVCLLTCDTEGICDTTFLVIIVEGPSIPPVAIGDVDTAREGRPVTVNILENDSLNGSLMNMEILEGPANGQVVINVDNSVTYTPDGSFCNSGTPDFFMYGICNEYGCDTAVVEVWVPCTQMEIMTGFSPNNDGINDFFMIRGIEGFPNNQLKIFNRWGSQVFAQNGYKNRWNGRFKDRLLPDGTYFYLFEDGKGTTYSGYVQIQR